MLIITNFCAAVGAVAMTSNPVLAVFLRIMHVRAVVIIVVFDVVTIAVPEYSISFAAVKPVGLNGSGKSDGNAIVT
jgi:hypothetical protein